MPLSSSLMLCKTRPWMPKYILCSNTWLVLLRPEEVRKGSSPLRRLILIHCSCNWEILHSALQSFSYGAFSLSTFLLPHLIFFQSFLYANSPFTVLFFLRTVRRHVARPQGMRGPLDPVFVILDECAILLLQRAHGPMAKLTSAVRERFLDLDAN